MPIAIKDSLRFGWQTFKARPWFFVGVSAVLFLIGMLSGFVQSVIVSVFGEDMGSVLSFLVSIVVNTAMGIGFLCVYLKAHDSVMSPTLRDLWHPAPFWKYLGAYLLMMVILVIGFILLIIPGIILSVALMFTLMLVVDKGLGPIEALKESARLTKGKRWALLGFGLVMALVNVVGCIALFVGLLVTIPVTLLATVHVYRQLTGSSQAVPEPVYTSEPAPVA